MGRNNTTRIHRAKDGKGLQSGKLISARLSDEAISLLRHECAERMVKEACYTPVGKLIGEAVIGFYGPRHAKPELIPARSAIAHKGAA